jgi:hypothetical protein
LVHAVIRCTSADEGFAKNIYDYLFAELEKHANLREGRHLKIDPQLVRLVSENNEIEIDEKTEVPSEMVKWILERFLESDRERFKDYGVIQFEDTFTVSKIVPASQMGIYTCDLCSYSTLYEDELYRHRILHAGFS